jgi:hypothetical protein
MSIMQPISVLQTWVQQLTFMQQSVLITAIRGPDGIDKNHVSKLLIRWLRRCVLYSAFESRMRGQPMTMNTPYSGGGGSFTGPSIQDRPITIDWRNDMMDVVKFYLASLDAVPHHFQLHFMHAIEIVGYEHPDKLIRQWWETVYHRISNDMHLNPETIEQMRKRLGDQESTWRSAEEVTAKSPGEWP